MSHDPLCVRCERPTPDGWACTSCARRTSGQLATITELALDGRHVAMGLVRRGDPTAGTSGPRIPINLAAAAKLDAVQTRLTDWCTHIYRERGTVPPWLTSYDDPIVAAARFLTASVEWMRHRAPNPDGNWGADQFLQHIDECVRVVVGVANGPVPGRYAGRCGYIDEDGVLCNEDVTARPGSNIAVCKVCHSEYNVDERQQWMRDEIEDHLARPIEIAGVLLRLGTPIGYSTIAAYAAKNLLTAHGHDEKGRPLYRIGDVIDLRMGAKKKPRQAG